MCVYIYIYIYIYGVAIKLSAGSWTWAWRVLMQQAMRLFSSFDKARAAVWWCSAPGSGAAVHYDHVEQAL